jgi:hypothetical protein
MARVNNIPEFIKKFIDGQAKNLETFRTYLVYDYGDLSVLQYKKEYEERDYYSSQRYKKVVKEEILAYRFPDGSCICNANQLRSAGRGTIYAKTDREGENEIQKILQHYGAVPLPFTLFTESKLDVRDFMWVCKPTAETVTVKRKKEVYEGNKTKTVIEEIERHFVGAAIFKVENEIFFFDVDRQELEHGIFNAFITKIPSTAKTPKDAYALLMPEEVKDAINMNVEVKRQGEFFFVKVSDQCPSATPLSKTELNILKYVPSRLGFLEYNEITEGDTIYPHRQFGESELTTPGRIKFNEELKKYSDVLNKLRAKFPSRSGVLGKSTSASHNVQRYLEQDGNIYASGKISQSRREHADLILEGWYKVIPNTGVFSWTITGNID